MQQGTGGETDKKVKGLIRGEGKTNVIFCILSKWLGLLIPPLSVPQ